MTRLAISCRFAPYAETPVHAVRNGAEIVELDGVYSEAFGPSAFLAGGRGATIQDGHDATVVGKIVVVAARGAWYEMDGVIESDDPELLARIKVGTPVSVGARILTRSTVTDLDTRVRMHRMAQLEHVSVCRPDERAVYRGAQITSVRELKSASSSTTMPTTARATGGVDWRKLLPRGYEDFADASIDLRPGDELTLGPATRGIRWDGQRFTQPNARAA